MRKEMKRKTGKNVDTSKNIDGIMSNWQDLKSEDYTSIKLL